MLTYENGCRAPCSELSEYCATKSIVRERCQATCQVCSRRARLRRLQGGGFLEEVTLSIVQPPESTRLPAQVSDPGPQVKKEVPGVDPGIIAGVSAVGAIVAIAAAALIYRTRLKRRDGDVTILEDQTGAKRQYEVKED